MGELENPVLRATRTSQRVRNMKVLNSLSFVLDTDDNIDDDEVCVIAKEAYEACIPPSREQSPVPMDTTPPKTASPPPSKSQNTLISPPFDSPTSPVPKGKPAAISISKEQTVVF